MNEAWWVKAEELNEEQQALVGLPLEGSYLVTGPPGSGKTNLLVLRANYFVASNYANVLILVLTKALRDFIAAGASKYTFSPNKVCTTIKWCEGLLAEEGIEIERVDDFAKHRMAMLQQVTELIESGKLSQRYDAIFLDEAQDYFPDEIKVFASLAKNIFAVADQRQRIYKVADSFPALTALPCSAHSLKYHYRNGLQICKFADAVQMALGRQKDYVRLEERSQYNEKARPSSVQFGAKGSLAAQCEQVAKLLPNELRAYPNELLGVICPLKAQVAEAIDVLQHLGFGDAILQVRTDGGLTAFDAKRRICVCTMHSAKGLEFRTLHMVGVDQLSRMPLEGNLAYMAATRAKTSLSVYFADNLPPYLESARAALEGPKARPPLSAAFGGQKPC